MLNNMQNNTSLNGTLRPTAIIKLSEEKSLETTAAQH
jgi:hypothetical protein